MTSPAEYRAQRLQSAWLYQGAAVMPAPGLTDDQKAYALTLRRQLVDGMHREAQRIALLNTTPRGKEWARIAQACRREAARTERAFTRLAPQVPA